MRGLTIPTYLSHSYRVDDQELNQKFWPLFERAGFYFSVDPPSNITSTAHLERMMNASGCYVAIITVRREIDKYLCSPFILYEFGLAAQARRPMLLLIEDTIGSDAPQFENVPKEDKFFFDRNDPLCCQAELIEKIGKLRDKAIPVLARDSAGRRPIGVILGARNGDAGYGDPDTYALIEKAAAGAAFRCKEISIPMQHNAYFALDLDKYEAVILDVRGDLLPEWVFAYVHGRLIPSLKLVRVKPREIPANVELPSLVQGLRMDEDEPGVECVIYWREPEDLFDQLTQAFQKLEDKPTHLRKPKEGEIYFNGIGRPPARVFISNHGKVNDLARKLSDFLGLHGIERFQYKDTDAIEPGTEWPPKIRRELQDCQVFVALISDGYWQSEWCREEMETALARRAKGMLAVLPYRVDQSDVSFMKNLQVPDLPADATAAVRRIFRGKGGIDQTLKKDPQGRNRVERQPMLPGASKEAVVDALRHFPATKWRTLEKRLSRANIAVEINLTPDRLQPRRTAEQLLNDVQRTLVPPGSPASPSPLGFLMDQVAALTPKKWKPSVNHACARLTRL
jgi:hypothetical protein